MSLRNIQHLFPPHAIILINTYKETPWNLCGWPRAVVWGDPRWPTCRAHVCAATIPLIDQLSDIQDVVQVWYANDASAAGSLTSIHKGYDRVKFLGPAYGYIVNQCKTWLMAKEQYLSKAKELSTTQVLRSHHDVGLHWYPSRLWRVYKENCEKESSGMVGTILVLAKISTTQPCATFTTFGRGYVHNPS